MLRSRSETHKNLKRLEVKKSMARGKTLQGERAADLATFMNDRTQFYGTATVPAGARLLIEAKGHRIVSQKLIDGNGNPLQWNITPAQEAASAA